MRETRGIDLTTLGIDLAADPVRTAACVVDWGAGTVTLLPRPATDAVLVEAIIAADMTGIDVPLGWPDGFVDAMVAHRDGGDWPPMATDPPLDRLPLRYRLTDAVAQRAGSRPLSVSTDLIGVAALRGARIQHLLREAGAYVDRSGTAGCVCESYPAGSLRGWGLPSTGYKGKVNRGVLGDLAARFGVRCTPIGTAIEACLVGCDDDEFDAVVCAVIARAAVQGQTTAPAPDQLATAQREGWIHLPTATPEEIMGLGPGRSGRGGERRGQEG